MGEKKMIKKERKSPSKKKVEPVAVDPSISIMSWADNYRLAFPNTYWLHHTVVTHLSGSGGITKSWISSPCTHQKYPQLVETNFFRREKMCLEYNCARNYRAIENIPWKMATGRVGGNRLVISGISSPAFAYCFWGVTRNMWRTVDCRITEPYSVDNRYMEFTNVIGYRGTYYVISRHGSLALIELDVDSGNHEITSLGRGRVVPNCRVSKHFREYLLEYKGEIYVVFLLSRFSIDVVDNVEVFRLDKSRLLLEKVDRLVGDAMFMLEDNTCMGISTGFLRCSKGSANCVYFTHNKAEGTWFVYDMKSGCISTTPLPVIGK